MASFTCIADMGPCGYGDSFHIRGSSLQRSSSNPHRPLHSDGRASPLVGVSPSTNSECRSSTHLLAFIASPAPAAGASSAASRQAFRFFMRKKASPLDFFTYHQIVCKLRPISARLKTAYLGHHNVAASIFPCITPLVDNMRSTSLQGGASVGGSVPHSRSSQLG
jgi:hypothetical protein